MPKGLLESGRLLAKVNGEWHPVTLQPKDVKNIQLWARCQSETPVEMDQTIYTCWTALHRTGVWPGDLASFEDAFNDVAVDEAEDELDEAIAALAVATGIAPNDLMETDFDILAKMVKQVIERAKDGQPSP